MCYTVICISIWIWNDLYQDMRFWSYHTALALQNPHMWIFFQTPVHFFITPLSLNNNSHTQHKGWGCDTLLIFSLGCVSKLGKCERTSQLSTTCVCSSVPVTMFPTALRAAVCRVLTQRTVTKLEIIELVNSWQIQIRNGSEKQKEKNKTISFKSHLNFHLLMAEERHKIWNNTRIYNHLDLLVAPVRQIGQSPHCVN